MLKRYNFIKQLNSYNKALDALKVKYGNIPSHSERSQLLAETLKYSMSYWRASVTVCSSTLKTITNTAQQDIDYQKLDLLNRKNKSDVESASIMNRLRSTFIDKKYGKVSIAATVAPTDDSLTIDNLTADINSNSLNSDSLNSGVNNFELSNTNTPLFDIESNHDKLFEHNYDYVTITFDPPDTSLDDDKLITSFSETVTSVITDSSQLETGTASVLDTTTTSTDSSATTINNVDVPIPEPPAIPEPSATPDVTEFLSQLNALGEATFESIGLGGLSPVGWVQNAFEYLHVVLGVPWWTAIIIGTIVIRFAMFPLVIIAQRNAAKMNNNLPGMQVIQLKMTEARQTGNQLEVARYSQELLLYMKEKDVNPFKNMMVPLAQMPIFISFFMGLRQMANVPVDSMRTGGLFWFTDLTVPDQFFALPIITSLTLWATIELGTDSAKLNSQNLQTMKYVLRAMPIVIIPFTLNFPGAILCYWVSTNFISLLQVGILKIPTVRNYFGIEPHITHSADALPVKNKGFIGGIKDSWTNMKLTRELDDRRRLDELLFQRSGKGPVVKTYKFDPTKVTAASTISVRNNKP